jgi:hypothetical protein
MVFRIINIKGSGGSRMETLHTTFKRHYQSMALVQWINLNLKGAQNSHAGIENHASISLSFLTPFGMTGVAAAFR